jgi:hypothetical protein
LQLLEKMKFNSGTLQMLQGSSQLRAYSEQNSSNQIFYQLLLTRKAGAIQVMTMDSFTYGVLNALPLRLSKFLRHK